MKLQEINGLKEGLNEIKIKVVSEDNTQNTEYIIKVTKTANLELANANLEILAIENVLLNPAFENNVTQYETQISNEITKLNIFAVPENEKGNVVIEGNENLQNGNNKITITVTAPNGITQRKYQINAYKRNSNEEQVYKQEQNKLQEKLEEAYEIEKISNLNENNIINTTEEKNILPFIIIGIVFIAIIIVIRKIIKR